MRFAGLVVAQTRAIAGAAFLGSCALTKDLVAAILHRDLATYTPDDVTALLDEHKDATGKVHEFSSLAAAGRAVQESLSDERHSTTFERLKKTGSSRTRNRLLACSMPHASDWLLASPIPALGLSMRSENFRVALKIRLGLPVHDTPFPCPAVTSDGKTCGRSRRPLGVLQEWSLLRVSPQPRTGHPRARGAGRWALGGRSGEEKSGSRIQVKAWGHHRAAVSPGLHLNGFRRHRHHPLQKKYVEIAMEEAGVAADQAHDKKLQKHLTNCMREGVQFVPLAWESLGGATETVHEHVRRWTEMEAARGATRPR